MEKHPDGVYYHFGLSEWIREKFSDLSDDQVPNQADILVNIDGIPLCKSSSSQFWPILGLIKGEHVPFTIGVFHGPVKPKCPNVYLRRFVSEVIFLQNNSIIIHDKEVKIKMGHNTRHHIKKTVLTDLQMDLVEDVPLDYMHLTCLGVMRKLICYWVKRDTVSHLIRKNVPNIISDRLRDLRKHVPREFARLPRSLAEIAR